MKKQQQTKQNKEALLGPWAAGGCTLKNLYPQNTGAERFNQCKGLPKAGVAGLLQLHLEK